MHTVPSPRADVCMEIAKLSHGVPGNAEHWMLFNGHGLVSGRSSEELCHCVRINCDHICKSTACHETSAVLIKPGNAEQRRQPEALSLNGQGFTGAATTTPAITFIYQTSGGNVCALMPPLKGLVPPIASTAAGRLKLDCR